MSEEVKAEIVVREPAEVVPLPLPSEDVVVLARNPEEMAAAQQGLIRWFERKIEAEKAQLAECEENWATAKQMKVRTQGWSKQVTLARNRVTFYEKSLAALNEGYCIVPDFPVQVFAVRTDKDKPPGGRSYRWDRGVPDVKPEQLKAGEGEYVGARPETFGFETPGPNPPQTTKAWAQACGFREVDFPFKLVKPQILKDLDAAMKAKIFDEIGILPQQQTRRGRHPDPVLVGRVTRKEAASEVTLSFLITWWIDTRTL